MEQQFSHCKIESPLLFSVSKPWIFYAHVINTIAYFFGKKLSLFLSEKGHMIFPPIPKLIKEQGMLLCTSPPRHMQYAAHVSHAGQMLSEYMVSQPINRDIQKSRARWILCWSNLNKRTWTKERRATIQARTRHPKPPQFQHVSLMGVSVFCFLLCIPSAIVLNGYIKRDPSFGISLGSVIKNLGSVVCLCLLIAIYGLATVMSVLLSNIAKPHTLLARLLKIDRCANKQLEDSSNMVKSGYATKIKLENELSKQGQCLFDWSTLCPL